MSQDISLPLRPAFTSTNSQSLGEYMALSDSADYVVIFSAVMFDLFNFSSVLATRFTNKFITHAVLCSSITNVLVLYEFCK